MELLSKLSDKKVCVPLILVAFVLLILLPPIIHGYVYPNMGDDTAFHLEYFDSIKNGIPATAMYLGRMIAGYPLVWLSFLSGLSVDTLFLWFNFGVLCLIGIGAYLMVALIFNWQAGLLTIPLILFVTPSTLNLFDNGAIFDLITVGILFPLFLLCLVYAIKTRIPWLWYAVALFPLLVCFHSISLVGSVSINSVSLGGIKPPVLQLTGVAWYLVVMMSRLVALVGCIVIMFLIQDYKKIKLDRSQKLMLLLLFMTMVGLGVLALSGFGGIPMRFATDLCIVLALFTGCLIGVMWQSIKSKFVLGLVVILIVLGSLPMAVGLGGGRAYIDYNSALTPTDLEAIKYVNSLSGDYYSCSSEVAPWIYGRFINKTYKEDSPIYIYRSKPMTYTTTSGSPYFWGVKYGDLLNKHILNSFSDDKERGVQIVIWEGK